MRYIIITCFALCVFATAQAQKADSIFVKLDDKGWYIPYRAKANETIFSIARKFHVPPAVLADHNGLNYQQEMPANKILNVPVAAYNYHKKSAQSSDARSIYFRATADVSLSKVARASQVTQKTIQDWNGMYDTELRKGQVLLVGWVLYDATDMSTKAVAGANSKPGIAVQNAPPPPKVATKEQPMVKKIDAYTTTTSWTVKKDTVAQRKDTLQPGEELYLSQTGEGLNVTEEKGTGVFFKRVGKSGDLFFAFHNTAKRGSIIKITNVGTEKTVYAKVIGPLPKTATYYNAVIGISADAKAELDAMDDRAWCAISYAP